MRASGVELSAAFTAGARAAGAPSSISAWLRPTPCTTRRAVSTPPGPCSRPRTIQLRTTASSSAWPEPSRWPGQWPGRDPGRGRKSPGLGGRPGRGLGGYEQRDFLSAYAAHVRSFVDVALCARCGSWPTRPTAWAVWWPPRSSLVSRSTSNGCSPSWTGPFQPPGRSDPTGEPGGSAGGRAGRGADVGLAFDGDADRVFLVDEKAEGVSGSLTTALVAKAMLQAHPGSTVLYNLICSKVVPETIVENGGTPVRTRVGHSFIKEIMAETGAVFGANIRATTTSATITGPIPASSPPWSSSRSCRGPGRRCQSCSPVPALRRLGRDQHQGGRSVGLGRGGGPSLCRPGRRDRQDRRHHCRPGDWWFNIRSSNTEPLLRLNVEATTAQACALHVDEVLSLVDSL